MKAIKLAAIALLCYVGMVVLVESLIGYFQPESEDSITLFVGTPAEDPSGRVLSAFELNEQLYVAGQPLAPRLVQRRHRQPGH